MRFPFKPASPEHGRGRRRDSLLWQKLDMEVAFRINLNRNQIDDNNAINANDGVKLSADRNENGVEHGV